MKQRKRKKLILKRMDNPSWEYFIQSTTMYRTRQIKPCKSYSHWCSDCNAVLFRDLHGRFPHTIEEFDRFENIQQLAGYKLEEAEGNT
jgi:hypothetical protein